MSENHLVAELIGRKCRCGATKASRKTFCWYCWQSLPKTLQEALYKDMGEGYEEAYEQALARLVANGRVKQ